MSDRFLPTVIDQVLEHVPDEMFDFQGQLVSISESAARSAPEAVYLFWHRAAKCIERHVGEPEQPWEIEVVRIFTGPNWPRLKESLGLEEQS